jgi:hypothetical protein
MKYDNNGFIEFDRVLGSDEETNWETLLTQVKENPKFFFRTGEVPRSFEWPGIGTIPALLPTTILAYTSGATARWEEIFKPQSALTEYLSDALPDQERPWIWNLTAERRYQFEQGVDLPENIIEETAAGALSSGESTYKGQSIGLFYCFSISVARYLKEQLQIRAPHLRSRTLWEEFLSKVVYEEPQAAIL